LRVLIISFLILVGCAAELFGSSTEGRYLPLIIV